MYERDARTSWSYDYSYDALNRIKLANYQGNYELVNLPGQDEDYSLIAVPGTDGIMYDKNGNITRLTRMGLQEANNQIDIIDDLIYDYAPKSNKLIAVDDNATEDGFKDISQEIDYLYDINGNMTQDLNKGIAEIEYNHLNLPTKITFDEGNQWGTNKIEYIYDATGIKLEKTVRRYTGANSKSYKSTAYAGNFIYDKFDAYAYDGAHWVGSNVLYSLQFFSQPEGYVEPNGSGGFSYVYSYLDHLGNIRLNYSDLNGNGTIEASSEILEENNFYPGGLKHKGYNNVVNGTDHKFGFNGKEENDELGLNWLDFGARMYDPAIMRWSVPDALAEAYVNWTPYNYGFNNPSNFVDPDGNFVIDAATAQKYPHLKKAIELIVKELKKPENSAKLTELVRLGEFGSEEDFFSVFTDNEGPKLFVGDLINFTSKTTFDSEGNTVTTESTELGDLGKSLNALIEADGGEGITDETIAVTISREANDLDKDGEIDYNESNTAIDDSVGNSTNSIFKKNGKINKSAFKDFMKVIVHEGVHVGDNKDKKVNSATGAGTEVGEKAEKVLGGVAPIKNFRKYEPKN